MDLARREQRAHEPLPLTPTTGEARAAALLARIPHVAEQAPFLGAVRIEVGRRRAEIAHRRGVDVVREPTIARIRRRQVELERARLVVDVAVLDPRDARHVDEPRHDLDPRARGVVESGHAGRDERAFELGDDHRREQLDVVIAGDDVDAVPGRREPRELGEHVAMPGRDHRHPRDARAIAARHAEQPLVAIARRQLRRPRHDDRHEVEQVARDHEAPRPTIAPPRRVIRDELAKRRDAELDRAPPLARRAGEQLLAEMQVADDEDVGEIGHERGDHARPCPTRQHDETTPRTAWYLRVEDMTQLLFILLLVASVAFFAHCVVVVRSRRVRPRPPTARPRLDQSPGRLMDVGIFFFGQKKVAEEGPQHRTSKHRLFIFWGFLIITIDDHRRPRGVDRDPKAVARAAPRLPLSTADDPRRGDEPRRAADDHVGGHARSIAYEIAGALSAGGSAPKPHRQRARDLVGVRQEVRDHQRASRRG